jgi:hypothetical protein
MKQIALLTLMVMLFSCNTSKISPEPVTAHALAPVIIYKTKADYTQLVPITLNETGDKVVSFPAPSDLYSNGILAIPVQLDKGYLLDIRGVHPHTAFTSYTYEAYSQLETAPLVQDLMEKIADPDPFVELYDCGNRSQFESMEKDLNKLIRKKFKGTKSLMK